MGPTREIYAAVDTFYMMFWTWTSFNTLRPRQNGRHFADDMFKCIFLNENVWIPIEISLKYVPKGSINNNPALFRIMAWRRLGDKPLPEPMMFSSLTHICVARPQRVKSISLFFFTSSTNWARSQMGPVFRVIFSNLLSCMKFVNFDLNCTVSLSNVSN